MILIPLDEIRKQLAELETVVINTIQKASLFGRVFIVTNAETGWVERSAEKFMPGLAKHLTDVSVLSARSTFEAKHPDDPLKWKVCAFESQLKAFFQHTNGQCRSHVVSFGDSHVERQAVRTATGGLKNSCTKSVKFAEHPTIEQLKRQLELIYNCLHYICLHDGDLDLQLTVSALPPRTNSPSSSQQQQQAQQQQPSIASSPTVADNSTVARQPTNSLNSSKPTSCRTEHNCTTQLPSFPRTTQTAEGS